ncbi:MAG TPA: type IV secretion system protein [Streptosporangiaceae bacterium]|nr:type IV secretion system protein [Streptosporangiaceae bacterium]
MRPPRKNARTGRRAWKNRLLAALAVLGLGLIISTYAAGSFASASVLGANSGTAATQTAQAAQTATPATTSTPITTTAKDAPAGGVCSVPGIGDIGGLLGLCSSGSSGLIGDLNNVCQPSLPQPEQASGGIDALIEPPASAAAGHTLYDSYGVAGQFWAAHGLQCSDMTSLIGNNVAGMVFDASKSIDRVTITVYQSAAGNGILKWLQSVTNRLISALGNAIYFPYLAPVIILGAIWMAWNGLVRKRATRALEGTLWMVVACAAAIWLIGRPADFTGVGTTVSNGVTQVLNVAFAKLPNPGNANCVPVQGKDPQIATGDFSFTSSNGLVDKNANELWSVLVCKPWLDGELGTTQYSTSAKGPQTVVNQFGRPLLWSQAIATNEKPTSTLIQAKQATYNGIANDLQKNDPSVYSLFQGNQWTSRLEIGFAALFASLVAGLLILLISLTLIILKLGFLLLLIAGPFFLIIGTHPGFGRIIAIRWFEMLVGVLMKQVAVAIALSVLLYCYSLIMGTADTVLPWALKILMIALVTVAVFIYRKPFQHLFSSVGYGVIGSQDRADVSLQRAGTTFRRVTRDAATATVPGVAAYRVGRWARRNPGEAAALASGIVGAAGAVGAGVAASKAAAGKSAAAAGTASGAVADEATERVRAHGGGTPGEAEAAESARGARPTAAERSRRWPGPEAASGLRSAPPLNLPPRTGEAAPSSGSSSGWSRGSARSGVAARTGEAPPRAGSTLRVPNAPAAPPPPRPAPAAPAPSASQPRAASSAPSNGGGSGGGRQTRSGGSWWPSAGGSSGARPTRSAPPPPPSSGPAPAPPSSGPAPAPGPGIFGGGRSSATRSRGTSGGGNGGGGSSRSSGGGSRASGGGGGGGSRQSSPPSGRGPWARPPGQSGSGPWAGPSGRPRWEPGPIRPSSGWMGGGSGEGGGSSGSAPPAEGQRDGNGANGPESETPKPFWLRPARRRK